MVFIARRGSERRAHDFPIGSSVLARPATVLRPIRGVVVETAGAYTIVVHANGLRIAVDVEDIHPQDQGDRRGRR